MMWKRMKYLHNSTKQVLLQQGPKSLLRFLFIFRIFTVDCSTFSSPLSADIICSGTFFIPNHRGGAPHQLSSSALLQQDPPHETLGSLALGASRLDMTQDLLRHTNPPPPSVWDCLVSCHHSMEQRLARKRVRTYQLTILLFILSTLFINYFREPV